jgi:hypothetical protein
VDFEPEPAIEAGPNALGRLGQRTGQPISIAARRVHAELEMELRHDERLWALSLDDAEDRATFRQTR